MSTPTWWRHYRPAWLRSGLFAGLTVWAVLVPESLAYASIAGVPPVVGLYAAVPALGIGLSLLLLLYRASRPNVAVLGRLGPAWVDVVRHPEARTQEQTTVVRVEGGLFFANADHVRERVRALAASEGTRAVVVDAGTVPFVDVTAAQMLAELAGQLGRDGVELSVARNIGQVRDVLRRVDADASDLRVYPTIDDAVAAKGADHG